MNQSEAIICLCGTFRDSHTPLTRAAFWKLFHQNNDSVEQLIETGDEQVAALIRRGGSMAFSLEELDRRGIRVVTVFDEAFPARLKTRLGDACPPLLYVCGDSALNERRTVGYTGSRETDDTDIAWIRKRVEQNLNDGYGVVTGGARGADNAAMTCAIENNGIAVVYTANDIGSYMKNRFVQDSIRSGHLLLYSHISPFAETGRHSFVAAAMERNKYIYAHSTATVVVRSEMNKGGTWAGALEALKHNYCPVYVWDNKDYPGNQKLLDFRAIPLSDIGEIEKNIPRLEQSDVTGNIKQMSIFDYLATG